MIERKHWLLLEECAHRIRTTTNLLVPTRDIASQRARTSQLADYILARLFLGLEQPEVVEDLSGDPTFVAELAAMTEGVTCFEPGFSVERLSPGGFGVVRGQAHLWIDDVRDVRPAPKRLGARVDVRFPCARHYAVPGAFSIVSRRGPTPANEVALTMMLNLKAPTALGLINELLNQHTTAPAIFEASVQNDPSRYDRYASAIIRIERRSYRRMVYWVRGFRERFKSGFHTVVPPFTYQLLPGVAVGAAPRDGEFLRHRSLLFARAFLRAESEQRSLSDAVRIECKAAGVQFDAPWRGSLGAKWEAV